PRASPRSDAARCSRRAVLMALAPIALSPIVGCAGAPPEPPRAPAAPPAPRPPPPPEAPPNAAASPPAEQAAAAACASPPGSGPLLPIPVREEGMETGAQFLKRTAGLHRVAFEQEAFDQISRGNVPLFLRRLVPLELAFTDRHGTTHSGLVHVACDYL